MMREIIGWVPTPMDAVKAAIELLALQPSDLFIDLGCGDGRVVFEAAKVCRAVGVDINTERIKECAARKVPNASFVCADLLTLDLSGFTAAYSYTLPHANATMLPEMRRMKGGRVATWKHDFCGLLKPQRSARVMVDSQPYFVHLWGPSWESA